MREPTCVTEAIERAPNQTAYPGSGNWSMVSLAQGNPGLALLAAVCDSCFPDDHWDREGREHLRIATEHLSISGMPATNLYAGMCGIAFAAWMLSRDGTRYHKLLASLDEQITAQTLTITGEMQAQQHGFGSSQFDLISGIAGTGAYLLCRQEEPAAAMALEAVVQTLVAISGSNDDGVPHWYVPPERIMQTYLQDGQYPDGLLDTGLAHGIAGPIALLALARSAGVQVEGLDAAIAANVTWLMAHRCDDEWGINWPSMVPAGPPERAAFPPSPSRTAWCYGNPGIARAIWLAGKALDRQEWRNTAIEAMRSVYHRPVPIRGIDSPTFCHGVAGLLQITLRFVNDTGLPEFAEQAQLLVDQLVGLYEPDSLLGFRDIEPDGRRVDQAGLLTGVPGVVMALLAATTAHEPTWDRLFLLS